MKKTLIPFLVYFIYTTIGIAQEKGPVTNLDIPRFVSLKASEANARRGPSLSHRIDWVFQQKGMPLEIYDEYDNWRRVRDHEGAGGWVHYSLLSGTRTIVVSSEEAQVHIKPNKSARVNAILKQNVLGWLVSCEKEWCEIDAEQFSGWIEKTSIWGVGLEEIHH